MALIAVSNSKKLQALTKEFIGALPVVGGVLSSEFGDTVAT